MPSPSATPEASCPNPEGGVCLGLLKAGTYTTSLFETRITYTVPDGWQNFEDLPGNFLLVAPGSDLHGVNAGGSDFIGIFWSVYAQNRLCSRENEAVSVEPGVAHTPQAIADEFAQRPGLVTTAPAQVSIGGLSGLVLDIRMADGWTGTCFYAPPGEPVVQLIGGSYPSEFDHPIGPGVFVRLYLLQQPDGTLAIEVDTFDSTQLDTYSEIIEQIKFGA
jgi:hypothetical protein